MPRLRSNSVAVYTEEEDVVFTSYGPVVVEDHSNSWLLGSLLAILSGILFTAISYRPQEVIQLSLVLSIHSFIYLSIFLSIYI